MYQDRIFAFTPTGELIQLPKGATPIDLAYAVHTDLGDQTVGAKINGRVVPLRTRIENGDQVEILRSHAQEPQPGWLNFVITGKARAAIRRFVRNKEQAETIALGRKFYDAIVRRLPAQLAPDAVDEALKRLMLPDQDALMIAIARQTIADADVMEALMPGASSSVGPTALLRPAPEPGEAISIKGLTPGVAYTLAECCHPVPGDRIVGLRRAGEAVEVHAIDCETLADGIDADWVDLAWGDGAEGGTAYIAVSVRNQAGALGVMASILGAHQANIVNLQLIHRDTGFHTFHLAVEVNDVTHLMRILAALRAADAVSSAKRI
jgi:(p)ppGpp synthase/HD superfamily hydrolase